VCAISIVSEVTSSVTEWRFEVGTQYMDEEMQANERRFLAELKRA